MYKSLKKNVATKFLSVEATSVKISKVKKLLEQKESVLACTVTQVECYRFLLDIFEAQKLKEENEIETIKQYLQKIENQDREVTPKVGTECRICHVTFYRRMRKANWFKCEFCECYRCTKCIIKDCPCKIYMDSPASP